MRVAGFTGAGEQNLVTRILAPSTARLVMFVPAREVRARLEGLYHV